MKNFAEEKNGDEIEPSAGKTNGIQLNDSWCIFYFIA